MSGITYVFLFAAIVATELLVLYGEGLGKARGYFLPVVRKKAWFLVASLGIRWVIAVALIALLDKVFRDPRVAPLVGVGVVLAPHALDSLLGKLLTEKGWKNSGAKLFTQLNVLTMQVVRYETQRLKEQDNYDCQNSLGWWSCGLTKQQIDRHLRMIYEDAKREIANKNRLPELMKLDADIMPGQKFYPLVACLGRQELRRRLEYPPTFEGWDGRERRRRAGHKADRKQPDPNPDFSRCSDNAELMKQIGSGKAPGLKT
jgi:hypothetical protein